MSAQQVTIPLEDYRWLTSDAATAFLRRAAEFAGPTTRLVTPLRKELSAERVHLVLEQVELRRRAAAKFQHAGEWFFTRKALEQATDDQVAAYKARRFQIARGETVLDLCCGIGGDLVALGAGEGTGARQAIGIDRDPIVVHLARENFRRTPGCRAQAMLQDAQEIAVDGCRAWHVDPDRRAAGERTTRFEALQPGEALLTAWQRQNPSGGIKLAPATEVPEAWSEIGEREWIGSRGECRQQMLWLGDLASTPGRRSATVVDAPGGPRTIEESPAASLALTQTIGRYLYEPHAAVLAARLSASLAAMHALEGLTPDGGYLTGDQQVHDGLLAAFAVEEVVPFDLRRLKGMLRERGIGRLEIKKRRVADDPEQVRKRLELRGNQQATLLLLPIERRTMAVVAQRVAFPETRA